jgi:hypothetical protein
MILSWHISTQLGVANYYAAASARVKNPKKPVPFPLPEALQPKNEKAVERRGKARPVEEIDAWLMKKNGR